MQDMVPAARGAETATEAMVGAVNSAKAAADGLAGSAGRAGAGLAAQSATVTRLTNEYRQLSAMQRQINAATGVSGGFSGGAEMIQQGQYLDSLRAKYNPLFAAQRQYRQELIDIRGALRQGAISEKEYADAIMNTKTAFTAQVNSLRGVTDRDNFFGKTAEGARQTGKAMQGLSFDAKNLSFQLVDVTQGLASGQPVFQIFAQQAGQIGQIIGTSPQGLGGLMKELGSAIARVLTPMRLLTAGVVGLGATITAAVLYWKNYALQLDDTRKVAGETSAAISGLNSAAAIKGIGDDEFFSNMRSFSQSAYEARINMGALAPLLRANGMATGDMRSSFDKVADLVKNAKDDITRINILQQAGLPATRQWIDFMSQGADRIKLISAGMKSLGGVDNERLIEAAKKFDEKWNENWRNMTNNIKSFGLSVVKAFEDISNSTAFKTVVAAWKLFQTVRAVNSAMWGGGTATTTTPATNRSDVANLRVSGAFQALADAQSKQKTTVDPNEEINRITRQQQQISLLGDLATVDDQVKQKELELAAAYLRSGISVGKYRDAVLNAVRAQAEMSRVQQQASIGVFNLDAANKAAADTLQMWIDKKLLDPNNAQQMAAATEMLAKNTRQLADAAKVAATPFEGLQRTINDMSNSNGLLDSAAVTSLNSVSTALVDMGTGATSAADGFKNMSSSIIRAIADMVIKMTIILPLARSLQGILGGLGGMGGGGILGSLFGGGGATGALAAIHHSGGVAGGGNVMRSVMPEIFIGAPRYHNGGIAGLAPDEVPAILQRGERITPRGASNDNSSGPTINIINQSSGQVERGGTRKNADGSVDIIIRDAVRNVMADDASKNGPISQGMTARMRGFNGQ